MTTIDAALRASAQRRPDALALADAPNRASVLAGEPQRLSWSEVDAAVDALAEDLARLGVGRGDSVAIQLPNVVELPISILAAIRMGAVAVPFPIQHREHELRHGFTVADVRAVVTADRPDRPEQLASTLSVAAELGRDIPVATFTPPVPGSNSVTLRTDPSGRDASDEPATDDVATVCWTSGTTGTPKGVPRTHSMWLASGSYQVDQLGITSDDRILCPFPVVNMAGIGGMLVPWAIAGGELHLHQPMDLGVFLGQVTAERITYTVAPPPLLNALLANPAMLEGVDLSHLRKVSSGSAPLDPWMVAGWQERGIEIVNVFGSNEGAAMLSTLESVPDPEERARYFPRPNREGVEIRLVDLEGGSDIDAPGRLGELRFTGPTVFDGYLQSSGEEFDDLGYYRTGDLFEWVDDASPPQLLRFVDRAKDIIIRGGMNVSAAEVEGLASGLESIVECAAVAYHDDLLGERVGLFAVAAPETTPTLDDVVAHMRSLGVASYKLPERLEVIDALPRNPVGKVLKPDLRDRWA